MFFTCKLCFQKSALVQQNSINEHNTNIKKEKQYGISVTQSFLFCQKTDNFQQHIINRGKEMRNRSCLLHLIKHLNYKYINQNNNSLSYGDSVLHSSCIYNSFDT